MKIAGNKKKSKSLDTVERSTLEEKKNNNFSSKFLNKKSGITMVALVVTIVVLLILASISIQGITRTGIFRAAEDTKLEHKRAAIATTLQTKLKINQTEQIRGTDEEIVKATYEDVKNDLEEIKKAGGKDIEVSEVTSEEKDGKTEWFFEVKVDGDVYKVGLDGSDYLGKEDELAPLIEIKKATATTNTITATVTTRRNEGGKIEYYIKEKGSQKFDLAGTTDQNTFKYTKLKQEKTYVIEAVAINTNGKKKVSKEYEIKTSLVPKIDSNEIKFASVPNEWTNKSVEVTATLTVDGQNFTLTTSKNSTSGWIASNRQIFTENGTMYAALTDGNNYGIAASHEVTNIDTTKPIVKSLSVTTNTIKITATDEASGIYSYAISESETMPKTFTKLDNSTQVFNTVVENLKQSTKYYVWVKDVAGNISEVASTKTGTVPKLTDANTTITKSPNDWTTQEVTATVTTTEKNYALQTKKDNGEWQTTNSQKYTENGTIYARLWDGTNAGEEIYKPITNIDKTAPTATNIEIKNVTPAGYDVYVYGVKDNGSGVNRVQFPTWTEAKGQDDIQPNWQTGASSKGTKQADGTTWVYHVNITDHKTEAGEYNTHIYAYDNLENGKCIGTQKVTIPMVKITYDENYVKDGTTNKQTVEKVYNTELGTLGTPTRTGYTFAGWFTETAGGAQISSTTKTPVTDTTYYAHWNANPLNFANQTISKTFSTSEQKADITGASNGTGNYTYTEKTEKNSAQKDTNYISINGTTITIAANTPADTYTYVIVATDNNSKVTKEATYTIKIERAKTANAGASDKTYNGTNQTGVTGTSVTWTGTTSAIDAGTYTANATPDANHAWSDGTTNAKAITWKMNPKSIAVTWGTTTTFTYNGQPQAPTVSATSGITGETINVTRTTGTNAGSYTSTASISSVTGGRARKENYTLTGNTKAFTINKANATMTDPTLATGLVYNTKAQNLIAKAGNGAGGTIKYGLGANNTTAPTSWNTSVTGTDARTYYVWSKVDADGNHNNVGAKYIGTVTIAKATVTIPTSPVKQYTYNGKAQAHGYTLPTGTAIENNGTTASATDAGTYNIVLKLTSASNYQWSDKTTTNKTINWKINPKSVTVTWGATSFTYNGQPQAPTASATSGITGETINITRTTGTNAGSYTSTASISSVTGGRARKENYTLTGNTKAFTINKANATMTDPTLATGLVYNTKAQNLIAKAGNGAGGTIKYGLGANNTTAPTSWNTSVTGTDARTYYVWSKVDADGNHNNVGAKYIGTVTIAKATVTIPTSPVKQYTYNGKAQAHGYSLPTGTAIENNGTTPSAIDAGTYNIVLKLTSASNYQWSDKTTTNKTINWKINPKSVAVTWGATSFTYNGQAQAPTASATSGVTGETINVTRTTATNAGNYTSTANISSVSGGRAKAVNYALSGNTKAFTIARAKTASASASNKTYNGKSQTGVTGGSVIWSGTTATIDAGTYTANATPDANHAWSNGTTGAKAITWTMNKKTVAVTWGATSFTYNGSAQGPTASASSGVTGETINVTRTTGTNAGSYTSTASISSVSGGRANKANYTLSGNTKAFTINPSSTAIKVYYPTSATAVSLKTVYRNKCSSSSTVLSTTNTGTSNNVLASTYNGLYGSFGGYATAVNTTTRATTAIAGIATRAETTYYVVTTGSNTSSITATFNYYNGSAWTSTTKAGTRTNNYAYYCTSTTAAKTATAYSHGSIAAPSTSAGPYSTAYVGWSTGSKSMSTTSVTTANTTYYAVYRSNVAVKVVTGTAAANVTSKTIYRNAMKDGTFLSESNTGTSNLTTISGAYNYAGLATSTGTTTCATITTCAASTTRTFYTVGKTISNSTITVTYKYQNGSNDKTASGTKTVIKKYYVNSSNQVTSNSSTTNPQFTMPTATKTGCNFAGWNTSNTATTATYTAGQKVSIGSSTTLYGIWIINGSVGLSATSGSTCTGKETTFTVNSNPSGGKLSVSSANTGIATTSISGTTVTVTPKAIGSTTITVTSAANKNYTSASKTYTITVGNHNATTGGTLKSAATCTAAAVYYHKCSICGKGLSSTYSSGSALGHNYTSTKRMGSWSWTENTGTWSAANAQGMKTAMFNNAGTYARFTYTSYGAHTMRILYFGAQTGYSLDFCLGTSTNATASGVTGYRGWAGGTVQFWVGGKLNSTVNHGASAGNGVYNSYIDWGHGGSGSWTFTIHANSPNTGAHPASCIRYYCSRCSHYEDRHEEY